MQKNKVQLDLEKNEEADYECQIKVSKHLYQDLAKSIMMAIVSDEEFIATAALKLIEVFLESQNEVVLDNLIYKCIRYLSEGDEEEYNLCLYFQQEIENKSENNFWETTIGSSTKGTELSSENTEDEKSNILDQQTALLNSFKKRLPLIIMTLNPKNDEL